DNLGLLVKVLVAEHNDDDGQECNNAGNNAHVVPQPELNLVLFGSGLDMVSFLPKLGAYDYAGKVKYKENNDLPKSRHELEVDFCENYEQSKYFAAESNEPKDYCACTQSAGITYGSCFNNLMGIYEK
ncbi:MAG: hypothetical protein MJ067_06580, partial [Oscillospiraceae bacterium]|nr:hypothetical protein [Oscillospiraceae bacterium]